MVALGYAAAVLGGMAADRVLGQRLGLGLGLLAMLGAFSLMALERPGLLNVEVSLLTLGNGLFKPSIMALVASLYPAADNRWSGAYGWLYFSVNLGGALGPLAEGALRLVYGWPAVFGLAPAAMGIAVTLFIVAFRAIKPAAPAVASPATQSKGSASMGVFSLAAVLLAVGALGMAFAQTSGTLLLWARDYSRHELWGHTVPPDAFAALP